MSCKCEGRRWVVGGSQCAGVMAHTKPQGETLQDFTCFLAPEFPCYTWLPPNLGGLSAQDWCLAIVFALRKIFDPIWPSQQSEQNCSISCEICYSTQNESAFLAFSFNSILEPVLEVSYHAREEISEIANKCKSSYKLTIASTSLVSSNLRHWSNESLIYYRPIEDIGGLWMAEMWLKYISEHG